MSDKNASAYLSKRDSKAYLRSLAITAFLGKRDIMVQRRQMSFEVYLPNRDMKARLEGDYG